MGLAGAGSGVENRVGKGRGIVGVCDRAGRRSVTRLQRKVAVTRESPAVSRIGRRTFPLAMRESGPQEGKFVDRGLPIDAPHTNHAQTALSRPTRALCVANDASREPLLVPGPPLTHPVFEPATSARPATGTTWLEATPKPGRCGSGHTRCVRAQYHPRYLQYYRRYQAPKRDGVPGRSARVLPDAPHT